MDHRKTPPPPPLHRKSGSSNLQPQNPDPAMSSVRHPPPLLLTSSSCNNQGHPSSSAEPVMAYTYTQVRDFAPGGLGDFLIHPQPVRQPFNFNSKGPLPLTSPPTRPSPAPEHSRLELPPYTVFFAGPSRSASSSQESFHSAKSTVSGTDAAPPRFHSPESISNDQDRAVSRSPSVEGREDRRGSITFTDTPDDHHGDSGAKPHARQCSRPPSPFPFRGIFTGQQIPRLAASSSGNETADVEHSGPASRPPSPMDLTEAPESALPPILPARAYGLAEAAGAPTPASPPMLPARAYGSLPLLDPDPVTRTLTDDEIAENLRVVGPRLEPFWKPDEHEKGKGKGKQGDDEDSPGEMS